MASLIIVGDGVEERRTRRSLPQVVAVNQVNLQSETIGRSSANQIAASQPLAKQQSDSHLNTPYHQQIDQSDLSYHSTPERQVNNSQSDPTYQRTLNKQGSSQPHFTYSQTPDHQQSTSQPEVVYRRRPGSRRQVVSQEYDDIRGDEYHSSSKIDTKVHRLGE